MPRLSYAATLYIIFAAPTPAVYAAFANAATCHAFRHAAADFATLFFFFFAEILRRACRCRFRCLLRFDTLSMPLMRERHANGTSTTTTTSHVATQ